MIRDLSEYNRITRKIMLPIMLHLILLVTTIKCSHEVPVGVVEHNLNTVELLDNGLASTDLLMAYTVFRHGDRTPDLEELALNPNEDRNFDPKIFYPFGTKALTNKGKQRSYRVGVYLRKRYNDLLSRLYIPEEITVRTTDYARTKMTALVALAAMYPPPPAQRWNPTLNWQPVPYYTKDFKEDDLLYWYNCPIYLNHRDEVYLLPEMQKKIKQYDSLFKYLTEKTGANITIPEEVFYLDNLFQALENVGIPPPKWAQEVMPSIKEMTKIEYTAENYTPELIKLSAGVLMADFLNASSAYMAGSHSQPKLQMISGHENNVAAFMAASRVFYPHQPNYGSTFSLELRKNRATGHYGVMAVYVAEVGGPVKILPVKGCGGLPICDFERFVDLTQEYVWSHQDFLQKCPRFKPPSRRKSVEIEN